MRVWNSLFKAYRCSYCGRTVSDPKGGRCNCGQGVLLAEYDLDALRGRWQASLPSLGVWDFGQLLPPPSVLLTRREGYTPLFSSRKLGSDLDCDVFFKDEGRNPSGSFKDRGTAVMFSCLPEDVDTVVLFSSGNAASSAALYGSLRGIKTVILMYQGSREKTFMAQAFGALCFEVDASEGELAALAKEAAKRYGWYLATTVGSANPTVLEGYKTIAYEIAGDANGPVTSVVVPMSSGTLLAGIWKGFDEIKRSGTVDQVPKMVGVQVEAINPIYEAFVRGKEKVLRQEQPGETIAKGLTLEDPGADGDLALRAIRSTGGAVVQVSDEEILEASHRLAVGEGLLVEPSGAASVAGLIVARSQGVIERGEKVVCVLTGSGLKDISPIERLLGNKRRIKLDIEELGACVSTYERRRQ